MRVLARGSAMGSGGRGDVGVAEVVALVEQRHVAHLGQRRAEHVAEVERWIALDWVRPDGAPGQWQFTAIDVARLRLIQELRHDLRLEEDALPVVLRLMDQLYDTRRQLRRLRDAVEQGATADARDGVLRMLLER